MTTRQVNIQRLSVISARSFESVVAAVKAAVGHPDMGEFNKKMAAAKTYEALEGEIRPALG